jgi:uncharacterized protein (DUF983 family)
MIISILLFMLVTGLASVYLAIMLAPTCRTNRWEHLFLVGYLLTAVSILLGVLLSVFYLIDPQLVWFKELTCTD